MNLDSDQQLELDEVETKGGPAQFRCAYFYYVTPETPAVGHPHANVEAFLMQEEQISASARIEDLIPVWAQQAKDEQLTAIGWAFGDLRWRRRNHFVVVVNAPGYHLDSEEALVITGGGHTFTDKTLMSFTTTDGTKMQAIHCLNHVRRADGTAMGERDRDDFYPLKLEFAHAAGSMHPLVTHDDTGTNIGPRRH